MSETNDLQQRDLKTLDCLLRNECSVRVGSSAETGAAALGYRLLNAHADPKRAIDE